MQVTVRHGAGAIQEGTGAGSVCGPVGTYLGLAAVDAPHGQDHHARLHAHFGLRRLVHGQHARHLSALTHHLQDLVLMQDLQAPTLPSRAHGIDHAQGQFTRAAPHHVISGQGVAVAKAPTFHPVHGRQKADAFSRQPVINLGARLMHVILSPLTRQHIRVRQLAKSNPIPQGHLRRVGNFHAGLLRRTHQGHATKSPQGQTTQAIGRVAVNETHRLAGTQALQRRHQARQTASGNHHICTQCLGHLPHLGKHSLNDSGVSSDSIHISGQLN